VLTLDGRVVIKITVDNFGRCFNPRLYGCESPELDYSTLTCLQQTPVESIVLNTTNNGFNINAGEWSPLL
jgi:hypothetical protein